MDTTEQSLHGSTPTFSEPPPIQEQHEVNAIETIPESQSTTSQRRTSKRPPNGGKKREVSMVWEHFTKEIIDDSVKAVCKYCKKKLAGHYTNGTTHLKGHYDKCPRRLQLAFRQTILKVKKNENSESEVQTFIPDSFDKNIARQKIARMIVMHEIPLSFVEYEAFRDVMDYVQPLVGTMSRNTLKKEIFKLYESEKRIVATTLENCSSRIAVTTDMWTATNQKKAYMVVTTHFIDKSWTLQNRILRFIYVPSPHGSETLCEELVTCLMDWNVDRRLCSVTVDNCSTNDAMIRMLKQRLNVDSMMLKGKFMHMRCCAHILNLIVKDGMKVIEGGIEKIRDSVTFWTTTPKRVEKFEEAAKQLIIPCTRKLVVDCPTRWNSTYLMLTTALQFKEVFARMKQRDPQYNCLPKDEDWQLASAMCEHLESFYSLTEIFSGTQYPTTNIFFPLICDIRVSMDEWKESPYEEIREMTSKMIEKFRKYWDVIYGVLAVAVVLDPRYNRLYLKYSLTRIYGHGANKHMEKILDVCQELYDEYKHNDTSFASGISEAIENQGGDSFVNNTPLGSRKFAKRTRFLEGWETYREVQEAIEEKSELELYYEEKVVKSSEDFDILIWWKTNKEKYPILSKIAKDIMAIPISTVASESAFSTSGRHISPHRSRLHPSTLEALMCTQNWLWSSLRAIIPENEIFTGEDLVEDENDFEDVRTKVSLTGDE